MSPTIGTPPYYSHGGLTIYHADCRAVLPTFGDESFDFVLTEPPYLVNSRGRWDGDRKPIIGDDTDDWLRPTYAELWRLLKPDTFFVSFYGWPQCDRFVGVWKRLGFQLASTRHSSRTSGASVGSPAASTRPRSCSRRAARRDRRRASPT